jgi:MSHA pilin protein MshD
MCTRGRNYLQRGVSLIELVIFIVIIGVSVAGVLVAIDQSARASADPLVIKQALAIGEAMLEEVELMPFTFCDPDDAAQSTAQSATSPAQCATTVEVSGPETNEARIPGVVQTPFDNVNDYAGYDSAADGGIKDITGTLITGLGAFRAQVAVAAVALGGIAATDADGQANVLLITVTVTGPVNVNVVLQGYRTKYAPNL